MPHLKLLYFVTALASIVTATGCPAPQTSSNTQAQQNEFRRRDRGEALVDNAIAQLADLPDAVDLDLRPPTVLLDSSTSTNGADMMAICIANPNVPDSPINIINVQSENGRFRRVASGDILKYYILEDETVDEERRAAGLERQLAKELTVAQVIDDNTLFIEGSLPEPVLIPAKVEVWRYSDDRLLEINEKLVLYHERRLPPLGWEPGPDEQVITQIVAWLNKWLRQSEPKVDWQRDLLLNSLDGDLLSNKDVAAAISPAALAAEQFEAYDGRLLQEAIWLRDVSHWAQGDNFNDLARATALFDWTIRNVQLDADGTGAPHRPWQTLLYGHGTANERAWVFAQLARQQGLDVVMLGVPIVEGEVQKAEGQQSAGPQPPAPVRLSSRQASPSRYWLPAVLLNKQLYLFDPRLGLPIPGPNGEGVATLEQVQKEDAILRQFDLENSPYPVTADALKSADAFIVANPFEFTRRAAQLETKLIGDDHLVLTSSPSQLAAKLKEVPGMTVVKLWEVPFRTLHDQLNLGKAARHQEALAFEPFAHRPALWKARTRHFQGRRDANAKSQDEAIDDHREAAKLYTDKTVRPPDRQIARTTSSEKRRVETTAKSAATYWLGLLSFDDGKYDVAADWLGSGELSEKESPWSAGARYNLARTLEAQSKFDEAAKILNDDTSPQQHGNRIRAKRLQALAEKAKEKESE